MNILADNVYFFHANFNEFIIGNTLESLGEKCQFFMGLYNMFVTFP